MARLNLLILEGSSLRNFHTGKEVANFYEISTGFDLEEMTRLRGQSLPVIMDSKNWKVHTRSLCPFGRAREYLSLQFSPKVFFVSARVELHTKIQCL